MEGHNALLKSLSVAMVGWTVGKRQTCKEERYFACVPGKPTEEGHSVFFANASFSSTAPFLRRRFQECGNVKHFWLFTLPDGRSRGMGVVEYQTPREARYAITVMHDRVIDGRALLVKEDAVGLFHQRTSKKDVMRRQGEDHHGRHRFYLNGRKDPWVQTAQCRKSGSWLGNAHKRWQQKEDALTNSTTSGGPTPNTSTPGSPRFDADPPKEETPILCSIDPVPDSEDPANLIILGLIAKIVTLQSGVRMYLAKRHVARLLGRPWPPVQTETSRSPSTSSSKWALQAMENERRFQEENAPVVLSRGQPKACHADFGWADPYLHLEAGQPTSCAPRCGLVVHTPCRGGRVVHRRPRTLGSYVIWLVSRLC